MLPSFVYSVEVRLRLLRGRKFDGGATFSDVGLVQALGYEVPEPNAAQRAMWHVSASPPGAWLFARSLHHVDKLLLEASHGRFTVPGVLAGLPVLTVVATGARSGQRRRVPLLGVPAGDDLAVIGTRFGQAGTPAWYYNLRADPDVQVEYRDKTVPATAREVEGDERAAIWTRARQLYAGYEAYARRIRDRPIHVMVLSAP
jgi:deazaflavin-dependent oxidoreductase (nitroreductase family)